MSVANPYSRIITSSSVGITAQGTAAQSITSFWTGRGSGGDGQKKTPAVLAAEAAEARRARDVAAREVAASARLSAVATATKTTKRTNMGSSKGAGMRKAAAAVGEGVRASGSGSKRGRELQERCGVLSLAFCGKKRS